MPPTTERRRSPRRPIVNEQIVAVSIDGDNGGLVLDLAENGVAVQAVTPLQSGKATEMAFVLPDSNVSIRAHGKVCWAEPSGRAGIRLLAFSEGTSADIRAALLKPAPPPVVDRPRRPGVPVRALDVGALEVEIASLDREAALARVAERTRELVSASGVAIAYGSREQMMCRASSGAAPAVGVRLQGESGLSGECVRSGVLVRCDDTQTDARVDAEVCRQLDLRSAVLVPLLDAGQMCGVLEVFSSRPFAFASDDIRCFEQVAALVAKLMREPAASPAPPKPAPVEKIVAPVVPPPVKATPRAAVTAEAFISTPIATPAPARTTLPVFSPAEESPSSLSRTFASPQVKYGVAVAGVIVLALAGWGLIRRSPATPKAPVSAVAPASTAAAAPVETPAQPVLEPVAVAPSAKPEPVKAVKEPTVAASPKPATVELVMRELPSQPAAESEVVTP
ncbi:MAG TPA: GAF domain-containing protein, partial [Terriglobales bacterium]|nr:GAF domain-containing protein [Terriglobales bacterium]